MNEAISKKELRLLARQMRNGFSEEYIREASRLACEMLCQTKEFKQADTLLIYYPIKNEISPLDLLQSNKRCAFPVCSTEDLTLSFREVTETSSLTKTELGTYEPSTSSALASISPKTVCIVPALAFSTDGYRLGYGKGYYDRFLKEFNGITIGLSFDKLLFDYVPHEEHDVSLDMIITEREVYRIDKEN